MRTLLIGLSLTWFFLSLSQAAVPKDDVISTFKKYTELNEDFKSSVDSGVGKSGKPYLKQREEVESFYEASFLPAARKAKDLVCDKSDGNTLKEYMAALIGAENTSDEESLNLLGDMYACQSDLFTSSFNELKPTDQKSIYESVVFGFENTHESDPNYAQLKEKLRTLEKATQNDPAASNSNPGNPGSPEGKEIIHAIMLNQDVSLDVDSSCPGAWSGLKGNTIGDYFSAVVAATATEDLK